MEESWHKRGYRQLKVNYVDDPNVVLADSGSRNDRPRFIKELDTYCVCFN